VSLAVFCTRLKLMESKNRCGAAECRVVLPHVRCISRAAREGLRGLSRSEQTAGQDVSPTFFSNRFLKIPLLTSAYSLPRGYNIGVRLIEDFLARTGLGRCKDFAEVGEVMSKVSSQLVSVSRSLVEPIQRPHRSLFDLYYRSHRH